VPMTGAQLATFCEELNGGASIGDTLLFQLINMAKANVEQRRPWMILRYTDTSKTVSASTNAWQTAIDLSSIARFSRFYGEEPVKNFDGNHRIDYYRQLSMQKRLQYKEAPFTFVFNDATKALNAGTLWIDHLKKKAPTSRTLTNPNGSSLHGRIHFSATSPSPCTRAASITTMSMHAWPREPSARC
jgi:hypothetical protein